MAELSMIDSTKSFTLTAFTRRQITDPVMVDLAIQMSMPQLLSIDEPTDHAEPLSIAETGEFIAWLQSSQWASRLEKDLQCMTEDEAGRPLGAWIALGMGTVYFDWYEAVA